MLEVGRIQGADRKIDYAWNRAHFGVRSLFRLVGKGVVSFQPFSRVRWCRHGGACAVLRTLAHSSCIPAAGYVFDCLLFRLPHAETVCVLRTNFAV